MSDVLEKPIKRRDVLGIAAAGTFLAAAGATLLWMMRLVRPQVFPEPSRKYKIGEPESIPPGEVTVPSGKAVFVFREPEGFYAISSICTHLGCIVKMERGEFKCPCHGSRFDMNGKVKSGAASRALDWYAMSLAPDGQLVVDEGTKVKEGTFFSV